jgi:hypothetical protein
MPALQSSLATDRWLSQCVHASCGSCSQPWTQTLLMLCRCGTPLAGSCTAAHPGSTASQAWHGTQTALCLLWAPSTAWHSATGRAGATVRWDRRPQRSAIACRWLLVEHSCAVPVGMIPIICLQLTQTGCPAALYLHPDIIGCQVGLSQALCTTYIPLLMQ